MLGPYAPLVSSSRSQRARSPTTTLTLADLPRTVRGCPLTSAGVCGGCYSFSYSPAKGRGGGAHGPDITRHGLAARHLWRAMGDASPVMSGQHSAGDGKSCRRAPCAGTNRLPDRPVSPARLALIDDVARVSARGTSPDSDIHRTSQKYSLRTDTGVPCKRVRSVETRGRDHGRVEHRKDQPTRV